MKLQSQLPFIMRDAFLELAGNDRPDLSARQIAVILLCHTTDGPHTVRGLAARLGVAKPVITRATDRLMLFDLVKRERDVHDRRNVIIGPTPAGSAYIEQVAAALRAAVTRYPAKPARRARRPAREPDLPAMHKP